MVFKININERVTLIKLGDLDMLGLNFFWRELVYIVTSLRPLVEFVVSFERNERSGSRVTFCSSRPVRGLKSKAYPTTIGVAIQRRGADVQGRGSMAKCTHCHSNIFYDSSATR